MFHPEKNQGGRKMMIFRKMQIGTIIGLVIGVMGLLLASVSVVSCVGAWRTQAAVERVAASAVMNALTCLL